MALIKAPSTLQKRICGFISFHPAARAHLSKPPGARVGMEAFTGCSGAKRKQRCGRDAGGAGEAGPLLAAWAPSCGPCWGRQGCGERWGGWWVGQAFQSPPGPFPRSRAPPGAQWLALVPLPAPRATLRSAAGSEHPKSALYSPAPRPCPSRLMESDTLVLGGRASGWSRDPCSSPLAGALLARAGGLRRARAGVTGG